MHDDVRDHSPARRGVVDPPALEMRRQVHRMKDAHAQDATQAAGGDKVADRQVRAGVAEMMVGREGDALRFGGAHHFHRLVQRHRQRLLAEHVLARRDRRHCLGVVLLVRRRNIDRVDLRLESSASRSVVLPGCHAVPRSRRRAPVGA